MDLLTSSVVTDRYGSFTVTGDYTCPTASSQVYLVARGGNPGLLGNVSNGALVLLSALGSCGNLSASTLIYVNEVSTVAAAYALAPFMTAYDHVGASATNSKGIANAFLNARLLANTATGQAAALPVTLAVETGKLYALADAIASCVNSDGTTGCAALFTASTPSGGAPPTDTLGALLNIVKHPANNVGAVFNCIAPAPPYATSLASAPNDWTMSLKVTGGGLDQPTGVGLDGSGNVWVTNLGDPDPAGVVAFSPQGTAFPGSPFGAGVQTDAYGLAIDRNGDVWVPSAGNVQTSGIGSVAKFGGASRAQPGALMGQFSDPTLNGPQSVATDPAGTGSVLLGNYVGGTVTIYDLNGNYLHNLGGGVPFYPDAVTSDGAGGAWVGDQDDQNIVHLLSNGVVQAVACCNGAVSVNVDLDGNVWAGNYSTVGSGTSYGFSEVSSAGTVLINQQTGGGLNNPIGSAIDAGGQFWAANEDSSTVGYGSISEIAGNHASVAAGTALSPAGGLGLDAAMLEPYAIAADASGNVWVSDQSGDAVVMFFGLATPTATPATPVPTAP